MWNEENDKLSRNFTFRDFKEAWSFMTEVAMHAEAQNHHPNWTNVYNTVLIELNTHDEGDIVTEKDRKLAETIDGVYRKFQQ